MHGLWSKDVNQREAEEEETEKEETPPLTEDEAVDRAIEAVLKKALLSNTTVPQTKKKGSYDSLR
jgi:hypothetical protein